MRWNHPHRGTPPVLRRARLFFPPLLLLSGFLAGSVTALVPAVAAAPPPAPVGAAAAIAPPVVVTVDALGRRTVPGGAAAAQSAAAPEAASPLLERLRSAWTPEGQTPSVTPPLACAVIDEEPTVSAGAAEGNVPGVVLVGVRAAGAAAETAAPAGVVPVAEGTPPLPAATDGPLPAERVRLEVRLPRGVWRVDAALLKEGEAPRRWRMQSVWQKTPGVAVKLVTVPAGETLTLRFTETVAAAARAHKAASAYQEVGGKTYGGASVKTTLARVGDALNGMPALIAGGKRDPLVKKAHVALLAAAQAHAMCQNARQATLSESEPAFDALLETLSEISCAAHGLVPRQTVLVDADGKETVQVSLTNAGGKTVPLVAIGLAPDQSAGSLPTQQMIFYKLKPGKQVAARFPGGRSGEAAEVRGAVQFNVGMGTAVVLARPEP